MALIYITGIAASGKSAVQKELKRLGYEALDVDDPSISAAFDNATGKMDEIPDAGQRTNEWLDSHSWRTIPGVIDRLKFEAKNKTIFLCGIAEKDPAWVNGYDEIICLDVDEPTLRNRISTRTDNDFGKSQHELERILEWHKTATQKYIDKGAKIIDATQPIEKVVSEVIGFLEDLSRK